MLVRNVAGIQGDYVGNRNAIGSSFGARRHAAVFRRDVGSESFFSRRHVVGAGADLLAVVEDDIERRTLTAARLLRWAGRSQRRGG
jgi:hypothetical protein